MEYLIGVVLAAVVCTSAIPSGFDRERVFYYHNDHLGTPQVMTDQTGAVVWSGEYEPFGKATVNDDPDGDGQRVINNLRFPGQYYDAETGLPDILIHVALEKSGNDCLASN